MIELPKRVHFLIGKNIASNDAARFIVDLCRENFGESPPPRDADDNENMRKAEQ